MNRSSGKRGGRALLIALGALALLALPGVAVTQGHGLGHGHGHDHADAGTIQSFDPATGKLAIALTGGDTVSGLVTTRTRVRCDDERGRRHGRRGGSASASRHGDSGSRDGQSGKGPRDDDGSRDDPPGHDGTPPGSSEDPGKGAERSERCNAEDLVAGTPVDVAEMVLIDGSAIYKVVVLDKETESDDE